MQHKAYFIKVPYGVQKRLAELFRVSPTTISETLQLKHTGKDYQEIIKFALWYGGEYVHK